MAKEWFTAQELADLCLPGLPTTKANILARAKAENWLDQALQGKHWRPREGRGGGVEFNLCVLPFAAKAKLAMQAAAAQRTESEARAHREALSREEAWAFWERQPDRKKAVAKKRAEILDAVYHLIAGGSHKKLAQMVVAKEARIGISTLRGWDALVRHAHRSDWVAYLIPRHAGAVGPRAACDPEALRFLRSLWLSPSQPTADFAIRKTRQVAAEQGWVLPSDRTLLRHLKKIDRVTAAYHREGPEAASRMFPSGRRDKTTLHAMEALNADGHRFDVMCEWPDGTRARPMGVFFQDVYSGKILSWRVDCTENKHNFRLALGDVVETFGVPDHLFLDNTRAAANKLLSGGVAHRFRFKVNDEEPLGILPMLGVVLHWTTPYRGQSKPIERAFRDLAQDISRHPAFEGAYLGNSPENKPHNAGTRAVPIAEFLQVLERGVAEHNARPGRTAPACRGRSFDDTFADSYATAPIRKATAEQRRLCLLAAEAVTVRMDATIHLLGNRYHHEALAQRIGERVVIRFDPDKLHAPVHVMRFDGDLLCMAECWADVGFASTEDAEKIAKANKRRRRAIKMLAEAEKAYDAEALARRLRDLPAPSDPPPETRVVRPIFRSAGNAALKPVSEPAESDPAEARDARQRRVLDALRAHHGTPHFRVVEDD